MQIYLARNNQQAGPYTLEQLNQMLATGQVLLDDLVWHEGMPEWKKLGELTGGELFYSPQGIEPLATAIPVNLNKSWADHAKPVSSTQDVELAPIEKRFIAKAIDIILIWLPLSIILLSFLSPAQIAKLEKIQGGAAMPSPQQQQQVTELLTSLPEQTFFALGVYMLGYYLLQAFLLKKSGQTIGKKALGIRIVDEETGKKTTLLRSFIIRSLAFIVLANLFSMFGANGLIMYLIDYAFVFSQRRQTLHDRLARTIVVTAKPEQLTEK